MGIWKKILPSILWTPLNELRKDFFPNTSRSYSGEGEDLILSKLFKSKQNGFYIDIGCYHPKVNSNTYYFYKQGWNGINIDANPESIKKFKKFRSNDTNVNIGIAEHSNSLEYYMFNEAAVNTFSKEFFEQRKKVPWLKYLGSQIIPVQPLSNVLERLNIPDEIDFMDIDVEGLDIQVLRSNNWKKYIPKVILVEDQTMTIKSFEELETYQFLTSRRYSLISKTFSTLIFAHHDFLKTIQS